MARDMRVSILVALKNATGAGLRQITGDLDKIGKHATAVNNRVAASAARAARAGQITIPAGTAGGVGGSVGTAGYLAGSAGMIGRIGSGALAVGGIGLGIGAIGAVALAASSHAVEFEKVMYRVQRSTSRTSGEMEATARDLGKLSLATGRNRRELGETYAEARYAGRPIRELGAFTEYAAKSAVVWGQKVGETGKALSDIGNTFRLNQGGIQETGDAVNYLAKQTGSKEGNLLDFVNNIGQLARQSKLSAQNLAIYGAAAKEAGVDSDSAGTAFGALLTKMKTLSKDDNEALNKIGLSATRLKKTFDQSATGGINLLLENIAKLPEGAKKTDILGELFDEKNAESLSRMAERLSRVRELMAEIRSKSFLGSVGKDFEIVKESDVNRLERAGRAMEVLGANIGKKFLQIGGNLAEGINTAVAAVEAGETLLQRVGAYKDAKEKAKAGNEDKPPEPKDPPGSLFGNAKKYNEEREKGFLEKYGATRAEAEKRGRFAAYNEQVDAENAALRQAGVDRQRAADARNSSWGAFKVAGSTVRNREAQKAEDSGEIARRIGQERMANIERLRVIQNAGRPVAFGENGPNLPAQRNFEKGPTNFGFGKNGEGPAAPGASPRPANPGGDKQQIDVTGKVQLEGKADVGVQVEVKPNAMFDTFVRTIIRSEVGNIKINGTGTAQDRGPVTDRP